MKNIFAVLSTAILFFAGCESPSSTSYEKKIVVSGLLESGRTIDTIRVSYTGEVDKLYTPSAYAIINASVKIFGVDVLFEDSLVYDTQNPGRYYSPNASKIILPGKTYRLEIRTRDGNLITAVTTVPDTFRVTYSSVVNNSTVHYNPAQPATYFTWSPSNFLGTYLPTISSLDQNAARIPKIYIKDTTTGLPPDKVGYRVGLPKEQTNAELPWTLLSYFGKTRFDVYAIDENYNNFLNQYTTSQLGELKEFHYAVQGALGFFGSRTQAKGGVTVNVTP